jgi:long-chain acyl-CoA synthetase
VHRIGTTTGVKARLAAWALGIGRAFNRKTVRNEAAGPWLGLRYRLADRLVLRKIREAIGLDQCIGPISGAAPISADILDFFASLGIVIYEVYGQSEDCGPTTINLPGAVKLGTVGRPIPGMEVRIAGDGEILIRAPSLFDGYAKDRKATAATLADGWMLTGDLGRLDDDGYLTIIGRKKDIIITSGGKNIAPANLENDLMDIPLVEHAVVVGEGRNYLTALLTLAAGPLGAFAAKHGLTGDLAGNDAVRAEIQKGVDAVNARYARVEHIRKFAVLAHPLGMGEGELTATLKVKRNAVIARNAALVETLYAV